MTTDQPIELVVLGQPVKAVLGQDDLWFSQRSAARMLGLRLTSVNEMFLSHSDIGQGYLHRKIEVQATEGSRVIRRSILHANLAVVLATAIRGKRFDVAQALIQAGADYGIERRTYPVPNKPEWEFSSLLKGALTDITEVIPQFQVGMYRVDFYLPEVNLAIEFDELHHNSPLAAKNDLSRMEEVQTATGAEFVRVREGEELAGLNAILRRVIAAKCSAFDVQDRLK